MSTYHANWVFGKEETVNVKKEFNYKSTKNIFD